MKKPRFGHFFWEISVLHTRTPRTGPLKKMFLTAKKEDFLDRYALLGFLLITIRNEAGKLFQAGFLI